MPRPKKPAPAAAIRVQHSLSEGLATELQSLIASHVRAQINLSWVGGGDPLDAPVVKAQAELDKAELDAFIARLVRDGK